MAASFFNRLAGIGVGLAALGGVVNTALFNGKFLKFFRVRDNIARNVPSNVWVCMFMIWFKHIASVHDVL